MNKFVCCQFKQNVYLYYILLTTNFNLISKSMCLPFTSAGVGRTGTFVCVDRLLQQMRDNDTVDVFGTIMEMRRYRTNMVQTEVRRNTIDT